MEQGSPDSRKTDANAAGASTGKPIDGSINESIGGSKTEDGETPSAPKRDAHTRSKIEKQFRRTERAAQLSIFTERLTRRMTGPLAVSGAFLTASWLGLWAVMPPVATAIGVGAFAAAFASSPFWNKTKSLFVSKEEARARLDENLGDPARPAQMIHNRLSKTESPATRKLWDVHLSRLWEKHAGAFQAGRPKASLSAKNRAAVATLALSTLGAGLYAGDNLDTNLMAAFNWTADQDPITNVVTAETPLNAKAWVTQPPQVDAPTIPPLTPASKPESGKAFVAHKNSNMLLFVYGENATVFINGEKLEPKKALTADGENNKSRSTYQYETVFKKDSTDVKIIREDGTTGAHWLFDVTPDDKPAVSIDKSGPSEDNPLVLKVDCTAKDDFGFFGGKFVMTPPQDSTGATPLPSSKIPEIPIPGLRPCTK